MASSSVAVAVAATWNNKTFHRKTRSFADSRKLSNLCCWQIRFRSSYLTLPTIHHHHHHHRTPLTRSYFDLVPHFEGVDGDNVEKGILLYCASRYRDEKHKFRGQWYESKGGLACADTLWNDTPPDMTEDDWHKFMRYVTSEKFLKRSAANKRCRAKQKITVHQGRKSLAQNRYENRDPVTQQPASPISEYARLRKKKGKFCEQEAADNYARMIELQYAQVGVENPMTDEEIVMLVLGPCRSWKRSIGQKLPKSSLHITSYSGQRMYSQDEVQHMMTQMQETMLSKMQKKMMTYTAPLFKAMNLQVGLSDVEDVEEDDENGEDDEDGEDDENDEDDSGSD